MVGVSLGSRPWAEWIYARASYFVLLGLLGAWAWVSWRWLERRGESLPALARRHWRALACGVATASFVFVSVPPRLRVLSDETNLLGVAQSFALEKTAYNPTMAKRYYGQMQVVGRSIEKRALLYPFLVHIAHVLTGYRWRNGFGVNFVLLALLAAGLFGVVAARSGELAAAAAVILVATYPIVSLCAASSDAWLLHAALFGLLLASLAAFLRSPDEDSLALLWAQALVFAHTRYEAVLPAAVVLAAAAWRSPIRREHFVRHWWLYAATPLLLAPLAVQRVLTFGDYQNPPGVAPFSWAHLLQFGWRLVLAQFKLYDRLVPHAIALNWVAAGCLAWWGYAWSRGTAVFEAAWQRRWAAACVAAVAAHTVLHLSYYFGDYAFPTSARTVLPLAIAAALAPVAFHVRFPERLPAGRLLALALLSGLLYHPIAVGAWHTQSLELIRETDAYQRFVLARGDEHALYIYSRPGQITVLGYGAVDFGWANGHAGELFHEYRRRLYSDVIAVQRIAYATGAPLPDDQLDPRFQLDALSEVQIAAERTLRISRVRPLP
ncbi:MAG: hypothetical protein HY554_03270 [Elusimicrobia bacterium]|nr:hypothetical protein [Elusimicrobiota bacterium]